MRPMWRGCATLKEIGKMKEIQEKYLHHKEGNPLDEAFMIRDLMENLNLTQQEVSEETELSQPQISKRLSLLNLIPELQDRLRSGNLRVSTAYQLSKLPQDVQREYLEQEWITLKEVEAKRRDLRISEEVLDLLEQPIEIPTQITLPLFTGILKTLGEQGFIDVEPKAIPPNVTPIYDFLVTSGIAERTSEKYWLKLLNEDACLMLASLLEKM